MSRITRGLVKITSFDSKVDIGGRSNELEGSRPMKTPPMTIPMIMDYLVRV